MPRALATTGEPGLGVLVPHGEVLVPLMMTAVITNTLAPNPDVFRLFSKRIKNHGLRVPD